MSMREKAQLDVTLMRWKKQQQHFSPMRQHTQHSRRHMLLYHLPKQAALRRLLLLQLVLLLLPHLGAARVPAGLAAGGGWFLNLKGLPVTQLCASWRGNNGEHVLAAPTATAAAVVAAAPWATTAAATAVLPSARRNGRCAAALVRGGPSETAAACPSVATGQQDEGRSPGRPPASLESGTTGGRRKDVASAQTARVLTRATPIDLYVCRDPGGVLVKKRNHRQLGATRSHRTGCSAGAAAPRPQSRISVSKRVHAVRTGPANLKLCKLVILNNLTAAIRNNSGCRSLFFLFFLPLSSTVSTQRYQFWLDARNKRLLSSTAHLPANVCNVPSTKPPSAAAFTDVTSVAISGLAGSSKRSRCFPCIKATRSIDAATHFPSVGNRRSRAAATPFHHIQVLWPPAAAVRCASEAACLRPRSGALKPSIVPAEAAINAPVNKLASTIAAERTAEVARRKGRDSRFVAASHSVAAAETDHNTATPTAEVAAVDNFSASPKEYFPPAETTAKEFNRATIDIGASTPARAEATSTAHPKASVVSTVVAATAAAGSQITSNQQNSKEAGAQGPRGRAGNVSGGRCTRRVTPILPHELRPVVKGRVSPERPVPSFIQLPYYALRDEAAAARLREMQSHQEHQQRREEAMQLHARLEKYLPISTREIEWVKTPKEIEGIRRACRVAAAVLQKAVDFVNNSGEAAAAGELTTDAIDAVVHAAALDYGAYPSPLRYSSFPKSVCTSVNEVVCHGIPDDAVLQEGSICSIDVSCYVGGFHGDCARTVTIGRRGSASAPVLQLISAAEEATLRGITACGPGKRLGAVGDAIESFLSSRGYRTIPCFCGHGIGRSFHEEPFIIHVPNSMPGRMLPGMCFTVEPVVCSGGADYKIWDDKWTVSALDGAPSAQFEHTVLITDTAVEILTTYPGTASDC